MATPMDADRLLTALRNEGLRVVEHRSWREHNRNHKGLWGPVEGVMIHHTVTTGTQATVELCYNGHSNLPGPLCHGVIAKDGTVYLVGNGRANHAGLGDDDVLRAVTAGGPLPAVNEANTDGNRHFYGFEAVNLGDGKDPWPAAQLYAIEKAAAAVSRVHRWDSHRTIGHKEWQPGKPDPRGPVGEAGGPPVTMASIRDGVQRRLSTATPAPPRYEPFPGPAFFTVGRRSAIITAMGRRLVAEGCGRYRVGPGPEWTDVDRQSYAAWQRKLGYSGADADGIPGKTSWDRLRVPNV